VIFALVILAEVRRSECFPLRFGQTEYALALACLALFSFGIQLRLDKGQRDQEVHVGVKGIGGIAVVEAPVFADAGADELTQVKGEFRGVIFQEFQIVCFQPGRLDKRSQRVELDMRSFLIGVRLDNLAENEVGLKLFDRLSVVLVQKPEC